MRAYMIGRILQYWSYKREELESMTDEEIREIYRLMLDLQEVENRRYI